MGLFNADIIVFFALAAALGVLLSALKMHKTEPPKTKLQRPLERDF